MEYDVTLGGVKSMLKRQFRTPPLSDWPLFRIGSTWRSDEVTDSYVSGGIWALGRSCHVAYKDISKL